MEKFQCKEHPIQQHFNIKGVPGRFYFKQAEERDDCLMCHFANDTYHACAKIPCTSTERKDRMRVIVKKVVEPKTAKPTKKEKDKMADMDTMKVRQVEDQAKFDEMEEAKGRAVRMLRAKRRELASAEAIVKKLKKQLDELRDRDLVDFVTEPELRRY